MSPNPNYLAGRRMEYERKAHWEEMGYEVLRTAGSHGRYDLVAIHPSRPITLIQCKLLTNPTEADIERMIRTFRDINVPLKYAHQCLEIKIKGSKEVRSVTV